MTRPTEGVGDTTSVRVLLVEDNPTDAKLLRKTLSGAKGASFEVASVETLAAALERVRSGWPDVVLLDLSLPDSHGLKSVTTIRTAAPSLPVVVLTGVADADIASNAFRAGVRDYLVKDEVTSPVLLRVVRYAFERHALESALGSAEADFRALLAATSGAVFRLEGHEGLELLAAEEHLREELSRAHTLRDVVSAEGAAALLSKVHEGLTREPSVTLEVSLRSGGPARATVATRGSATILVLCPLAVR